MDHSAHAETILVVDSDPILCELIARMLVHQGYAVLQALSGEEALVTAARHAGALPLLVTEILMPGMDGFRIADLLTVSRPELRALFISGHYDDSAFVRQGLDQTQRPFLLKPFGQDELARVIREVLDRPTERDHDPFALILADPKAAAQPMQDRPLPHGLLRALRFQARLMTRYRTPGSVDWHDGVTENLSRSGVLFRSICPLQPKTPIDMYLTLPTGTAEGSGPRLRCQGKIVRVQPPETAGMLPRVAAAVDTYVVAAG